MQEQSYEDMSLIVDFLQSIQLATSYTIKSYDAARILEGGEKDLCYTERKCLFLLLNNSATVGCCRMFFLVGRNRYLRASSKKEADYV